MTESPPLRDELDRLQADRETRAARIIGLVESEPGIALDGEVHEGIGRPHIARAIDARPDTDLSYRDAFDELIGDDRPV